jgi:hypothetical protein
VAVERKEITECGYRCRVRIREARASASDATRWSRSESSKGVEDHGGGDSGGYSSSGEARFAQRGSLGELGAWRGAITIMQVRRAR